jgi:hypothetical protein
MNQVSKSGERVNQNSQKIIISNLGILLNLCHIFATICKIIGQAKKVKVPFCCRVYPNKDHLIDREVDNFNCVLSIVDLESH